MRKICFATHNQHKIAEVRRMLPDFRILSLTDIGCQEDLPETQETLEGNSFQKAEFVFTRYHIPCFADDTGLEVEALGGAPGVYSARYAGEGKNSDDNIHLLLTNLAPHTNRKARFRTVITLMGMGDTQTFEGVLEGTITTGRRGKEGFGYDPVFLPNGHTRTLAEMSTDEKNSLSHRGIAMQKLVNHLKRYFSSPSAR